MARKPAKRLIATGAKFDPSKHPRAQGGRWANKPGAGGDAPQGGKSGDVNGGDVFNYVSPAIARQMANRSGTAGQRFQQYKDVMTVQDMIDAGATIGVSRAQVLSDLTWAHQR